MVPGLFLTILLGATNVLAQTIDISVESSTGNVDVRTTRDWSPVSVTARCFGRECRPDEVRQTQEKNTTVYRAAPLLSGTDYKNGWDILEVVRSAISSHAPSISQADLEGFSNEQGFHILWQFSDSAHGQWNMGVLRDGQWVHFEMDLGNHDHRNAFFIGEVPRGCEELTGA
jgi:hypothetical protein